MQDIINLNTTLVQLDFFDSPLAIPVNRLDADQYSADDIDGVTESIFGSGNMAYASLQASQTDAEIALNDATNLESDPVHEQDGTSFLSGMSALENAGTTNIQQEIVQNIPTDMDQALDLGSIAGTDNIGAEGNFSNATVGALGISELSSDVGSFSPSSSLSLGDDNSFDNTNNSTTDNGIVNNTNSGDTIQNVINTVNETIQNITNLGDETIENITNLGDKTIENITNLGSDIVESIFQGDVQEIVNNVGDTITTEISDLTETINNILQNSDITNITNEITDTAINNVTNIMDTILGDGGIALHLDTGLLDSAGENFDVVIDDSISGILSTSAVSDNISALTSNLTGLSLPFVAGTGVDVGFDLLNTGGESDGNDLSIAGIDTPDINLDIIESLVGDIDINGGIPTNLADLDTLVSGVQEILGNLGDLSLADPADILNILGSQGGDGALGIVFGDTELGHDFDTDVDNALGDILDAGNSLNTGDISTAGIDIPDINLGSIENLLGDVDANSVVPTDLTDLDTLVADVQDIIGNTSDLGLADSADTLDIIGDAGLNSIIENMPDIDLSSVENITGNIDGLGLLNPVDAWDILGGQNEASSLDTTDDGMDMSDILGGLNDIIEEVVDIGNDLNIDDVIGMLAPDNGDIIDNLGGVLGDQDDTSWTESIIGSADGGMIDDIMNGIGNNGASLPDPVGTVAEGLGALHITPHLGHGGFGGLFG